MRGRLAVMATLGVLAVAATAGAGQRPDYSGTWVAASDATAVGPGKPAPQVYGSQFTIVHKDPALTLTRAFAGSLATIKYRPRRIRSLEPDAGPPVRARLGLHVDGGVGWTRHFVSR